MYSSTDLKSLLAPPHPYCRSFHRKIIGRVREPRDTTALAAQHQTPQILWIFMEHVVAARVENHPCSCVDLGVELAGGPPGIASEQPDPADFFGDIHRVAGEIHTAEVVQ